jgi:phage tail sheath gpL-like
MSAPLAVDPSNPKPGLYLSVPLLRGATSPGAAGIRALLLAPPATAQGDATADTEIRPVFSKEDVETAGGRGPGYYAYQALFANDPQALVDFIKVTESAGAAAAQTLTFAGAPTSNMTFRVWVMGWPVDLTWNVGEADTVARDNGYAKINEFVRDIMCVASAGAGGVVNLTANTKGPIGNDITLRVKVIAGAGGTLTAGGAKFAGGTTEHNITTALATAQGKEYDYILPCLSNADAQAASAGNTARLKTHINALNTGSNAKLQQGIYGSTGTIAAAKTNTAAENEPTLEHITSVNAEELPCELAAAEMGDRMRRRRREINANRVLQPLKRIRGSADTVADQPTDAEAIDSLNSGVTLVGYDASNAPILLRSVTTHHKDTAGNPDKRAFDTNEIDALYDYAKDLRAAIPQEFLTPDGQVKIARNRETDDDDLPAGVVEERDVLAFIATRTKSFWIPKGVIQGPAFEAALAANQVIVEVNDSDETQLDIFIPAKAVKILAKIGVVVAKEG